MNSICNTLSKIQGYYIPISITLLVLQCVEVYIKTKSLHTINNITSDLEIKSESYNFITESSIDSVIKNLEDRLNKCDISIDEAKPILYGLIEYNFQHL